MRFFRWVAGAAGVVFFLLALAIAPSAYQLGRVLDKIDLGQPQRLTIREISRDAPKAGQTQLGLSLPGEYRAHRMTFPSEDVAGLYLGDPITVYVTMLADPSVVTAAYYERVGPVWRIAGIPLAVPALFKAAGFGALATLLILFNRWGGASLPQEMPPAPRLAHPVPLRVEAALGEQHYRPRLIGLALLGHTFVIGMLLAYLGLLAGVILLAVRVPGAAVAVKYLILPVVVAGWAILRALWIKLEPPEGVRVSRDMAPALFATIDRLRNAARAPRPHRVLLTGSFNASITQQPRLGLLGWHRNYLCLGLPLLQALSPQQVEAVLAHELAHLARGHGRFGNWIYRVRETWLRIAQRLDTGADWSLVPFRRFLDWYAPRFHAYSFAHARAQEYEADRLSARLTAPDAAAGALIAITVLGRHADEAYWPPIFEQAQHLPKPEVAPFAALAGFFATPPSADSAQRFIDERLAAAPDTYDTHPTLQERLAALGQTARLPERSGPSAAEVLLGPAQAELAAALDRNWRAQIGDWWNTRHAEIGAAEARLGELAVLEGERPLTLDELDESALLTMRWRDADAAIARYRAWLDRAPATANALYGLGRLLLARDEEAALPMLEQAMQIDPSAVPHGCRLIAEHLAATGRGEAATPYLERAGASERLLEAAAAERQLYAGDKLEPHRLDDAALAPIREFLRTQPRVRRAWLARKRLEHLPEVDPYFVVLIDIPWFQRRRRKLLQAVADGIPVPGQASLFLRVWAAPIAARRIAKLEHTLIYSRDQGSSSVSQ